MKATIFFGMTTLFVLTALGLSHQALACAGCLDVAPEIIVLDRTVQADLTKAAPQLLKDQVVRLSEISCQIPGLWGSDSLSTCVIGGVYENGAKDFSVTLSGEAARILYHKIKNLTVEINHMGERDQNDDFPPRTGERIKATFISQNEETSTVTIPSIHYGTLTCPRVGGSARCEIQLDVLNSSLLSYQN